MSAVGEQLDASTSVVLLSDGRQVPLHAVVDDQLVATQNAQGEQCTFDLGPTGYGSGVACVPREGGGDLALYGLLVRGGDVEGDVPAIERTRVDLSDGGRRRRWSRIRPEGWCRTAPPSRLRRRGQRSVSVASPSVRS